MSTSGAGAGPSTRPAKASSPPPLLVTSGPNAKPHDLEHASTSSTKLFTLSKRLRGKLPAFNARLVTDGDSKRDILELGQLLDIPTSKVTPSQCGPALSEQEARSRSGKSPPQPPPNKVDANSHQAALLQSARRKVSLQDEEAIRKARITMMELSNSSSSSASWRSDPSFPAEAQEPPSGQLGSMEDYEDSSRTPTCFTGDRIASNGDVPIAQTSTNTTGVNEEALDHAQSPPAVNTDLVIAVVGHRGVGKSTVIRKAVKAWGVSEPVIVVNPAGHIRKSATSSLDFALLIYVVCSSFSMIQPGGKLQNALKVEFVEMNMAALNLSETSQSIWPTLLTRASGVILCYDALRQNTLQGIAPLLGESRRFFK